MFIAMNRFQIAPGQGKAFEERWATRESYLKDVPGFVGFMLLKGDSEGEYISHSTWRDRAAFTAWTQSPAFSAGHAQGSMAGMLSGPPHVSLYEAVLVGP
ncbi:MAG TPA: antibiotic biosynthesis monooxygenase [Dehalococcoidia bacterium]|nr:antibiotic biosynthesis monooxygenase [Dehalococcoidia bacterium]